MSDWVIDSSALIEWIFETPLAVKLAPLWPSGDRVLIPTMVQFECVKWSLRERRPDIARKFLGYMAERRIVPLTADLAVRAAHLAFAHKLASADAVIYATAQAEGASLLTCDGHFEGLPGVTYVAKA